MARVLAVAAVALLVAAAVAVVAAEDAALEQRELTEDEIRSMRIKDLRRALYERGVECVGCTQKEDLSARLLESRTLPRIRDEAADAARKAEAQKKAADAAAAEAAAKAKAEAEDPEIQEILAKARAAGRRGAKTQPTPSKPKDGLSYDKYWGAKAIEVCTAAPSPKLTCAEFGAGVSASLSAMFSNMAKVMGKTEAQVNAGSRSAPFHAAGERAVKKAWSAVSALDASKVDSKLLRETLTASGITQWWLNTIMGNAQNMFSGMGDDDMEELIRNLRESGRGRAERGRPPPPPRRPPTPPPRKPAAPKAEDTEPVEDLDAASHTEL